RMTPDSRSQLFMFIIEGGHDTLAPTAVQPICMKRASQYTYVALDIDDGYNECSRLLETVGGKNP
ncbi:MAG TPA: hypothetical protein VE843_18750, partial [Ktedonobacteraceae bacterium]|nr:hypothetical protein [Ktedonobacteraceae bacterium]